MSKIHVKSPLLFDIHPGEILRDMLEENGLSQSELARHIDVQVKAINEICRERRGISTEMAIKLSRAFGTSPLYWLNSQKNYDLSQYTESDYESIDKIVGDEVA